MFFEQIKQGGDNFSYIIANNDTKAAAVIDPDFNVDVIIQLIQNRHLALKYIINTHYHHDHVAGNKKIKAVFNAKIVAHELSPINKDISVTDGTSLKLGKVTLEVYHTPGHTSDSICLLVDNKLLTGDTLFVGECGRTDLPGGSSRDLYFSLFNKLMHLDDSVEVYPGHDYGSAPSSTIGLERETNYTLKKRSLEEFIEFMKEP